MKILHSSMRYVRFFFAILLITSFLSDAWAQRDSAEKYQNNYGNAVQLEFSDYTGIKYERVWGKLRKPRLGLAAGLGYSQNPDLFSSRFDFSRGMSKIHLLSSFHFLLPVSPNSDIEAGLAANYNLSAGRNIREFVPNEMIVLLKGGYRWHTANRKWSFHIGGYLTLADNLNSQYGLASKEQKFRINVGHLAPGLSVGRTF